VESHPRDRRH